MDLRNVETLYFISNSLFQLAKIRLHQRVINIEIFWRRAIPQSYLFSAASIAEQHDGANEQDISSQAHPIHLHRNSEQSPISTSPALLNVRLKRVVIRQPEFVDARSGVGVPVVDTLPEFP